MTAVEYVIPLDNCAAAPLSQVGGKAVGLGQLVGFGLEVPPGFVVTAQAYRACVLDAGLAKPIAEIVATATDPRQAQHASDAISLLVKDSALLDEVADQVVRHYESLGDVRDAPVAVRSSATAEDLADASFAGQQDTYLWICGADKVKRHIMRCWASLFTPRAIQYRARLEVQPEDLAMAVVIQQMVPAAVAGVLMTLEPVTGERDVIYIEGTYGLGEGVVRGDVGVDRHWVAKSTNTLQRSEIDTKSQAHRVDAESGVVALQDVAEEIRDLPCMSEREILTLAALGDQVETDFGAPMDIEWAIDDERTVFLLQARPETVWSRKSALTTPVPSEPVPSAVTR